MPTSDRRVPGVQIHSGFGFWRVDKVTATGVNDANGNAVQWTYDVTEMYKQRTGYTPTTGTNSWAAKQDYEGANTIAGSATKIIGYNIYENGNDGSGAQQSTGVDHDGADYPSTFDMTPLLVGAVYPGVKVQAPGDLVDSNDPDKGRKAVTEVWLLGVNGEDGSC